MSSTQKGVIAFSPLLNPKSQFRLTKFKLPFQTKDVLQLPKGNANLGVSSCAQCSDPSSQDILHGTLHYCASAATQDVADWMASAADASLTDVQARS